MFIANLFVKIILVYYTFYCLSFISKKNRARVRSTNISINKLRKIPVKTLEEQKNFLNLRYPKRGKWKFSWLFVLKLVVGIILFMGVYRLYSFIMNKFDIDIKLWQGIIFIMVFPILSNLVLEKFGLQKNDLRVFFK